MIKDEFTKLYTYLEARFNAIDKRFESVDRRFEELEGTMVDFGVQIKEQKEEFELLSHQVDRRISEVDFRLQVIEAKL
jgi:hypothetical protein